MKRDKITITEEDIVRMVSKSIDLITEGALSDIWNDRKNWGRYARAGWNMYKYGRYANAKDILGKDYTGKPGEEDINPDDDNTSDIGSEGEENPTPDEETYDGTTGTGTEDGETGNAWSDGQRNSETSYGPKYDGEEDPDDDRSEPHSWTVSESYDTFYNWFWTYYAPDLSNPTKEIMENVSNNLRYGYYRTFYGFIRPGSPYYSGNKYKNAANAFVSDCNRYYFNEMSRRTRKKFLNFISENLSGGSFGDAEDVPENILKFLRRYWGGAQEPEVFIKAMMKWYGPIPETEYR